MPNIEEAEIIQNYNSDSNENLREIPLKIRTAVAAAPNIESKIATLKKFYSNVEIDTNDKNNFFVTDETGKKLVLNNKQESNIGDVVDYIRPISQAIGGTVGSIVATPTTLGAGTIAGAGLGTAAGTEIAELVGSAFGTEFLRTPSELASERLVDFEFGAGGQLVTPLLIKGAKYTIVGGKKSAEQTLKRLRDFANAGASPSLGQATLNRGVQTVEMVLGNIPGSSGKISTFAAKAQDDLGRQAEEIASKLINKPTPASTIKTGQEIKVGISNNGVSGQNSFVGRFKSRSNQLFGELDNYIPSKTTVPLTNTISKLKDLTSVIPGAEQTSKVFRNNFLNEVFENLQKDIAKNGQLPYVAVKQLRSRIGNKLSDMSLITDVDKAQLKLVYGALSEDIKLIAKANGSKAFNSYNRANKFYQSGLKRIDEYLDPIYRIADPDRTVSLLLNSAKEGATRINTIKKSLTDEQYKVFVSSVIDRLGRARPSQAMATGAGGEVVENVGNFSSETFLTNWNSLSKQAKDFMFSGKGMKSIKSDLDTIARVSSVIRESGKTFKNPSGTADRLVGQGIIFGGAGAAASGNPGFVLVTLPLVVAGANRSAALLTNPSFIKWMAQGTKIAGNKGVDGVMEHMGRLGTVMANSDSDTRQYMQNFLQMLINGDEKIKQKKIDKIYSDATPIS